jgi:galactokinase
VSTIDALVEIASAVQGSYGARLTGGGFGGSIIVLCSALYARIAAVEIVQRYQATTGNAGRALVPLSDA